MPGLEEVDVEHIKRNHYPPEPSKCPLCRETYLKEAPAKKSGRKDVDVRIVAKEFGDVIDMDTPPMTRNNDGKIVEVEQSHPSAKMGVVMHDLATDDVVFQPVQDRTWRRVRDGLMMFGGPAGTLKKCVSDRAPEFKKALLDLMIAPFGTTPGRSTSHGRAERANRTVLEVVRLALEQSGLDMNFIPHAASHGLWIRRLTKTKDGLSIYEQKCPGCAAPSIWPFGAEVVFKPSKAFNTTDKAAPRGRKGVMIDYVACPGGAWTGDYLVAELAHFEANSGRKTVRIHQTKTVTWNGSNRPYFPIFEAVELARKNRLADGVVERAAFTNTLLGS